MEHKVIKAVISLELCSITLLDPHTRRATETKAKRTTIDGTEGEKERQEEFMSEPAGTQSSPPSRTKHRTFLDIVDACDTFPLYPPTPPLSSPRSITAPPTADATVDATAPSPSLGTSVSLLPATPSQVSAQGHQDQAAQKQQQQKKKQKQKCRSVSRFYARGECVGYLRHTVVETLRADFPQYFDILPVHDDLRAAHHHHHQHHDHGTLSDGQEDTVWDVFVRDGIGAMELGTNASGGRQAQGRGEAETDEMGADWNDSGSSSASRVDTADELTKLLNGVAQFWRTRKVFRVLEGRRDEQYTVYGANRKVLFTLERAACALFGLVTYGAHLNVYIESSAPGAEMQLWCPRRAKTKATFPGMLDNSVAGGISNGLSPYETIIKEANEEASIPEDIARKLIRPAGCISYIYVDGDVEDVGGGGWIQPEVQYIFDLSLTGEHKTFELKPQDGESENFELWPASRVKHEMLEGNFKPNCAAVLVDFFIRHGLHEEDGSGEYLTIIQRLHRSFDIPS